MSNTIQILKKKFKAFVKKLYKVLLPHLTCILFSLAIHMRNELGICQICDGTYCRFLEGEYDVNETT